MLKNSVLPVFWTDGALQNAISIKRYILAKFSSTEADYFLHLLATFETAVSIFPLLYPASHIKKGIRRAVLSKVLSVLYRIHKNKVEVLAIFDNRCDMEKIT